MSYILYFWFLFTERWNTSNARCVRRDFGCPGNQYRKTFVFLFVYIICRYIQTIILSIPTHNNIYKYYFLSYIFVTETTTDVLFCIKHYITLLTLI